MVTVNIFLSMTLFPATGTQIKSARTLLKWSQEDLANKSGIALGSIRRIENQAGSVTGNKGTLEKLLTTLEKNGIELSGDFKTFIGIKLLLK